MSRGFAELQQHEARLEEARLGVARSDAPCPTRCDAQRALLGARDRICALADELGDPDAHRRCEHARDTGEAGAQSLQQACGCAGGSS